MRTRPGTRLSAAALAVAVTMLAACGGESAGGEGDGTRVDGGTLVIAFPNNEQADAKSLDPNVGGGTTYVNSIYGAMFDQLVYQNPKNGEIVPGLAERWDVTPDGLKYTFHLKTGPKFWDGTPVTAEDVKFSLDRTVDKRYLPGNAYVSALMANYDRSTVLNPTTVEVLLKRPQTNFLPSVVGRTYVAIVSKAAAERAGVPAFGEKPMGSGAFKFVEWVRGDHITVQRNPDYTWGPSFFETAGRAPSVEKIVFRFISEDATRLAALDSGQVTAIQGVPPFDQDRFEKSNQHELITVRKNGQAAGLNLNTQRAPTDDLAVRQAVAYALDREAINRTVYAGKHFPARYILEERMGEWVNKDAEFPAHDVQRARQILDDAGWAAGPDGIRQKAGRRLELTAICAPDLQQTLTLVQSQLKEAGIHVDVQSMSAAQVSSVAQSSGEFNLAWVNRAGWTNEDPYLLYSLFDSKNAPPNGTSNYSRVRVGEFDRLLETAAVTADPAERKQLYYRAQQELVDYVPFVPVLSFNQNIVAVNGVHGLLSDMRGTYTYFQDVWLGQSLHSRWK
jgi:peptide/nickel transport system substrate-binding protein